MNKDIWDLYKNSDRGKEAISIFAPFNNETDYLDLRVIKIFEKYNEYFGGSDLEDYFVDNCLLVIDNIQLNEFFIDENESSSDYFVRLVDNIEMYIVDEDSEGNLSKREDGLLIGRKNYRALCSILSEVSLALYFNWDNTFFPILFREQFDVFMKSLDVLGIPMPELPAKSDKRGRLLLYNELNNNIKEFSKKHKLTLEETCACIYDFALMLIDDDKTESGMPKPTSVWLTGGSKGDYKSFLENPVKGDKSVWTCNENTKRGDIIIIYVLYPYSCIQSIWRADIDGVYTPFNYYNSRTRVTDGILTPKITLKELKKDPYFSKLPITRKNFQGVNGVEFSTKDYKRLLSLFEKKGFDTSKLPQLYNPNIKINVDLKNEKDVEENLLIPLLERLGYSKSDWVRQLVQKTGRKEKVIPDFVFMPTGEIYFQNAPMVIEAKYDLASNIERMRAYNQALSYARIMNSFIFGICDKNKLLVFKKEKGAFKRFSPIIEEYWQNINNEATFNSLMKVIGKNVISNKIIKGSNY